jgi:pyruvate,water dikinase
LSTKEEKFILWFDELGREEVPLVGGKSASLGEMTSRTKVPVPYGFATTAAAFRHFIETAKLDARLAELLKELVDPNDTKTLQKVGKAIRETIVAAEISAQLKGEIVAAYQELGVRYGEQDPYVAVRSSATAEDLPDASFAGQQETYLNVKGADDVVESVKECFASLFTDRAIFYRIQKGFDHMDVALSAAVQIMVYSKAAGVMFTLNVSNGDPDIILIEAGYGLGEFVVQGKITPDEYLVRKSDLTIVSKSTPTKKVQLIRRPEGGTEEVEVPADLQDEQVLTDEQIVELARYANDIERHYGRHMDIEWGLDANPNALDKLWILQARPETVWSLKAAPPAGDAGVQFATERVVLTRGLPAAPGLVAGTAHVIMSVDGINEFQEGEILVTEMTAPDWVPAMRKAKAIVTNSGGTTCHAAIVSRELGIPCIVGTISKGEPATDAIADGASITVDAVNGVVYEGVLEEAVAKEETAAGPVMVEAYIPTGTKILVNLGEPEIAERVAKLPCEGVGLMREEFIWAAEIGQHPLYLLEIGQPEKVVDGLAEGIRKVCQAMNPRPVVLRFSDFKTSEYRDLKGGEKYEPEEPSALLGWRGASRYYDPKYMEAFKLEVQAIKKVREEYGLKNLWVMLPFVRTVAEAEKVIGIMDAANLRRGPDFKVWLMAEIPSNVILADKFNHLVDGYSIGSNDLTMLILGCDRDNATVGAIFDERDLAVKRAIKHLIEAAHRDGKTVSICGQAPSVHGPDFIRFLVASGIDSISVNPDAVVQVRKWTANIEQRLILEKALGRGVGDDPDLTW